MIFKVLCAISLLLPIVAEAAKKKPVAGNSLVEKLKVTAESSEKEQQEKFLATEVLVSQSEEKALGHLKNLIKKYKSTSMEAGLRFRLAELYMNRAKSARFIEQIAKDGAVMSFLPKKIRSLKEKSMVDEAIMHYSKIEKHYPKFAQIDEVIFNKAFALLQSGKENLAEASFIKLLRTQKRSKLRPDSFLAVGEINFGRRKFKRALAYFQKVKLYKKSRVYPYGLYKGAWSYFNLDGYEQAIKELENVIYFGANIEKQGGDQRLDLRVEALSDMALFYSTVKPAQKAVSYFKNLAGNKDPVPGLRKLSSIYEKHGKDIKQEIVLIGLIKNFKQTESRPFFFKDLTRNLDRQAKYKKASSSLWAFYNSCKNQMAKNSELDEDFCQEGVTSLSRKMSLRWLKLYKEKKTNPLMASVSENAFRVHFSDKQPTDENSKMRFYFAEHLFDLKKYLESSSEYDKVGSSTKDEERHHKSRYASVVSYDKNYDSKFTKETSPRYRELSEKYMKDFPEGDKYLDVGFKLGLFDYTSKSYDLAAPLLLSLGDKYHTETKGKKSQDLYLDILNAQKKYVDIQSNTKKWKEKETDVARSASLQGIYEQAFFSEVEILEKQKEYRKALARYNDFVDQNPSSKLVDEARWNKIGLHFKLKEYNNTASGYISFHELHSKNEKAIPGLVKAVEIYEMMAEPEQAHLVTEILRKNDIKNKSRWNFLSATYLKSSGYYEKAAKKFLELSHMSPVFKDQARSEFFDLEDQLINSSAWYKLSVQQLASSKNRSIASLAVRTYAKGLYSSGNSSELSRFVDSNKYNKKLTKEDIGLLHNIDGEKKEREYFNFSIKNTSMDSIVAGIQKKTKTLDRVQRAYQKSLVDKDSKVVIKSLLGLSRTYQRFVVELKDLQPPVSFSKEEADALAQEIDNIIMPFEEKAAEALDQALKVANDSGLKDGSVKNIKILFDKVNFEEKTVYPVSMSLPNPISPRGFK